MTTRSSSAVLKALVLPEILILIAQNIPRQRDLLSCGLVHSSFHDVVIPYYLRFREISMQANHLNTWSYLLEDNRRLANVEVLRIEGVEGFSRSRRSVPPLPGDLTYKVPDPAYLIQSALQGMTNLREVQWEDVIKWPQETQGLDLCDRAFWDLMPRICHGVQKVSIFLDAAASSEACRYCELLYTGKTGFGSSEGTRFVAITRASSRLFPAFSRLEELCLGYSQILAFSNLCIPLLKDLRLIGVDFEDQDGLLRLLEGSPGLLSFDFEHWREPPDTMSKYMEILPGSNVVPLLESFTGWWEDAQVAFDPLLGGAFPNLSQVNITQSGSDDGSNSRSVDIVSKALAQSNCLVGANLRYLAISMTVEVGHPDSSQTEEQALLWTTWLTRIATSCPRLRGLAINAEDDRTAPEDFRDETDGWRSALSKLQELVALEVPHVLWQADKGKLLDQGQTMARTWSLYEDAEVRALDDIVAELIPLRNVATDVWLEAT
ncbi:hypothetical protein FS837_009056 [Tulasnella sp. UAMH 9824]|nr:hypothetical protein FS837_009056 [Tulasnella sp. UAMH 9824]